uniref:Periplasmic binding protein domain-containing protein n=1 Tax=Tanacetum cinerariifolium TaxID=118510 RepID=A0A699GG92_TANCI|nr:hypothetical protein [Tanacetum cinerariifolium]
MRRPPAGDGRARATRLAQPHGDGGHRLDDAAAAGAGLGRTRFGHLGAVAGCAIGRHRIDGAAVAQAGHGQDRRDVGAECVLERLRRVEHVGRFLELAQRGAVHQVGLHECALHFHRAVHQAFDRIGHVVRLVQHIGRIERRAFALGRIGQLVKYQEQLERIDAARIEVVVAILAVVEVETAQLAELRKTRHDHFDVGVGRVVAQIHQALGLVAQRLRAGKAGAPVGNGGGIERRFEQFMFDQQVPVGRQRRVDLARAFQVAFQRAAQVVLAGEVGAVAHPHRQRLGPERVTEFDAFDIVRHGLSAGGRADGRQAAVFVAVLLARLILEGVGVDGVEIQAVGLRLLAQGLRIRHLIPREVQRHTRRGARELMDHAAVVQLFEHVARLSAAGKTRKARAARAGAPAGQRDRELLRLRGQRLDVDAAARQDAGQRRVVLLQVGGELGVVVARVDVQDITSTLGRFGAGQEVHGFGDVLGQHAQFEHAAVAVERFDVVGLDLVGLGALLLPLAVPDARTADHGVRIDHVDADAVRRAFERNAAGQVDFGGFCGAVGRRAGGGDQAVLGCHEHHAAAQFLLLHDAERGAAGQEVALDQDVLVALPYLERGVFQRRRRGDAGVGDQQIHAAEAQRGGRQDRFHVFFAGDVGDDGAHAVLAGRFYEVGLGLLQRFRIDIGEHDARAFLQKLFGHGLADAAGAAGHQRDAARQAFRLGHALQFRFFQQPVFDVERFLFRQADVGVHAVRAAHHVDRIDVKLAGDARSGLVLGERQHAHAGNQVDDRIGVAHGRAVGALAALVVRAVVGAVLFQRIVQPRHQLLEVGIERIEIDHERTDLRAQEVVGARRAQCRQRLQVAAAHEFQHGRAVVEITELVFVAADFPAQERHQFRGQRGALLRRQRFDGLAAERRLFRVGRDPFLGALDDGQRGFVARLGGVAPGEQAVAFQDDPLQVGVRLRHFFELQTEVVAGTLPWQPTEFALEDFLRERLAAGAGGNRDQRIGVHVIDVLARDVRVQRRVDTGGARIEVERAVRQIRHHFIFQRQAAVAAFQRLEFAHVQGRETIELDAAQVTAGALHPQHFHLLAAERIVHHHLGRRIAAAEIGDAQIRTEQVGSIQQQLRFAHRCCSLVVPQGSNRGLLLGYIHCWSPSFNGISVSPARRTSNGQRAAVGRLAQRLARHRPPRHQLARRPQPAYPHPGRRRQPGTEKTQLHPHQRDLPAQYPVLRRAQARHCAPRGRHVQRGRDHHHQRRHHHLHDGRIPGRPSPQDPHQFLPDGRAPAGLQRKRDHCPRRQGLSRTERHPQPFRQRHHPAPLCCQDVHERVRPVPAGPHGSGPAFDPGRKAPDLAGRRTDRAGRQLQVCQEGGPDPVRPQSGQHRDHRYLRLRFGRAAARAVGRARGDRRAGSRARAAGRQSLQSAVRLPGGRHVPVGGIPLKRRKIVLAAVAAGLLTTIAGCGDKTANVAGGAAKADGEKIRIAMVVKSLGNGFFDAAHNGANDAAKELKNVDIIYTGPTTPSAEGQIEIINSLISQKVDAIVISANDPNALVPIAKKAMGRGIKVLSFDSGLAKEGRLMQLNPSNAELIGQKQIQMASDAIGGKGEIAILSASAQATNQNIWIGIMKETLARPEYAGMKLVATVYGDDQSDKSYREAVGLLRSNPNLKAIISPSTVGINAASKAVVDEKLVGKVYVTGLGLPSEMAGHVKSGAVREPRPSRAAASRPAAWAALPSTPTAKAPWPHRSCTTRGTSTSSPRSSEPEPYGYEYCPGPAADRDLQALCRHRRPEQCLAVGARRRSDGADRRERRRQIDAGQNPDRHLSSRRRHDRTGRSARKIRQRPGCHERGRDRRAPGNRDVRRIDGGREHLRGPPAMPRRVGPHRLEQDRGGSGKTVCAAGSIAAGARTGERPVRGAAPFRGDRPGPVAGCARGDPRRTHGVAVAARNPRVVSHRQAAARRRHGGDFHLAQIRRDLRSGRPLHGAARRPVHRRRRTGRHHRAGTGGADGGPYRQAGLPENRCHAGRSAAGSAQPLAPHRIRRRQFRAAARRDPGLLRPGGRGPLRSDAGAVWPEHQRARQRAHRRPTGVRHLRGRRHPAWHRLRARRPSAPGRAPHAAHPAEHHAAHPVQGGLLPARPQNRGDGDRPPFRRTAGAESGVPDAKRKRTFGRQPAEGRAGQMAGHQSQGDHPRRTHQGHRHRLQGRRAPVHRRTGRQRPVRDPGVVGAAGGHGPGRPHRGNAPGPHRTYIYAGRGHARDDPGDFHRGADRAGRFARAGVRHRRQPGQPAYRQHPADHAGAGADAGDRHPRHRPVGGVHPGAGGNDVGAAGLEIPGTAAAAGDVRRRGHRPCAWTDQRLPDRLPGPGAHRGHAGRHERVPRPGVRAVGRRVGVVAPDAGGLHRLSAVFPVRRHAPGVDRAGHHHRVLRQRGRRHTGRPVPRCDRQCAAGGQSVAILAKRADRCGDPRRCPDQRPRRQAGRPPDPAAACEQTPGHRERCVNPGTVMSTNDAEPAHDQSPLGKHAVPAVRGRVHCLRHLATALPRRVQPRGRHLQLQRKGADRPADGVADHLPRDRYFGVGHSGAGVGGHGPGPCQRRACRSAAADCDCHRHRVRLAQRHHGHALPPAGHRGHHRHRIAVPRAGQRGVGRQGLHRLPAADDRLGTGIFFRLHPARVRDPAGVRAGVCRVFARDDPGTPPHPPQHRHGLGAGSDHHGHPGRREHRGRRRHHRRRAAGRAHAGHRHLWPVAGQHPRHLHDHRGGRAAAGDHRPAPPAARPQGGQMSGQMRGEMIGNVAHADATIVLDIGKTNVKLVLLDADGAVLAERRSPNTILTGGPYPHHDTDRIWHWMLEGMREFSALAAVGAIVPVTHGATAALVDDDGLVLPVLDYEFEPPAGETAPYGTVRPDYQATYSPLLPAGLNLGRQLAWQAQAFPRAFATARHILMYPQYWAWRLSGVAASEVTSLGCHTDLWQPARQQFSALVERMGWNALFPPLQAAWAPLGVLKGELAAQTGLPATCRILCGIHDSNASLLRHLGRHAGQQQCAGPGRGLHPFHGRARIRRTGGTGRAAMHPRRPAAADRPGQHGAALLLAGRRAVCRTHRRDRGTVTRGHPAAVCAGHVVLRAGERLLPGAAGRRWRGGGGRQFYGQSVVCTAAGRPATATGHQQHGRYQRHDMRRLDAAPLGRCAGGAQHGGGTVGDARMAGVPGAVVAVVVMCN